MLVATATSVAAENNSKTNSALLTFHVHTWFNCFHNPEQQCSVSKWKEF